MTPARLRVPSLAVNPAIGMMTSEGSGGNTFSRNISKASLEAAFLGDGREARRHDFLDGLHIAGCHQFISNIGRDHLGLHFCRHLMAMRAVKQLARKAV